MPKNIATRYLLPRWRLLPVCIVVMSLTLPSSSLSLAPSSSSLVPIDIDLPSDSTGSPAGTLAVRVYTPMHGHARYPEGTPVLIWGAGGFEAKGINHELPDSVDDIIIVTFVYPGGEDPWSGRQSDGVYDYRGPNCIAALRDVILYAAGELSDSQGRTIDDAVPVPVLHDNVGLEGVSNGGNIIVAVAALYGDELAGHLRYIIQWETPVSSQVATRDLGRVWLQPPNPGQGDFFNPRYLGYRTKLLDVDYSDLAYDPDGTLRRVFHDGNDDGVYTTIEDPVTHLQTPDLNLDGVLGLNEDFPLDTYPDGVKEVYSRAVTHALAENHVITGTWPVDIAIPPEADAYWDIRESVWLYDDALASIPELEAMVLAGVSDHVQSAPTKPHIRQAFEGWNSNGAWVQINPSPTYLIEADPSLAGRTDLPNRVPNAPPADWGRVDSYCVPEDIPKATYQLAAVWQMADWAQGVFTPTPAGGELITYVDSEGDNIAVRIEVPEQPRYPEGAPVVVEVSTWFVPGNDFHRVNQTTRIGAITVSYLWPERVDVESGARSEGVYDYGGPDSLEVLRDVIRFASGLIPNTDGYYINELVAVTPLTDNVGLFASSHAGVVATNVLAHHGLELPTVKYLVGRENPTRDEMSPLELGHFDDQRNPVYNPFYDEDDYSPTTVTVDYSTVGWYQEDPQSPGRPYFAAGNGLPEHILHETICPTMWGKRYYSRAITQALLDNGALTLESWPEDLATPAETQAAWPFRITVHNYPAFATQAPNLKVMLAFAQDDHVQAAETKPHIHQAWDGFTEAAGLSWVRLNPDLAYVQAINPSYESGFPDNPANSEPADWHDIRPWGFPAGPGDIREDVWLASVAEMADRVQANNWDNNLDAVLYPYPPVEPTPTTMPTPTPTPTPTATPEPTQTPIFLPLILKGW
jgi:hypothetical protein